MSESEILGQGRWARLVHRDGWEYVERTVASAIVVIVALNDDGRLLLVEQYRPPVAARCVELPAGLVGDIVGKEDEQLETACRRELWEETGYRAERIELLSVAAPSAGISTELVHFMRARDLTRTGAGGGDAHENITVHEVLPAEVPEWLRRQAAAGKVIDAKIYAGLYFLTEL